MVWDGMVGVADHAGQEEAPGGRCGVLWYGMVWYGVLTMRAKKKPQVGGVVCYGMGWYGMGC